LQAVNHRPAEKADIMTIIFIVGVDFITDLTS
jgi:hypothetical protein